MEDKELKKIKEFRKWFDKYILKNFGEKCPDFVWGCAVCRAHFVKDMFGGFVEDLIETENWSEKQERKSKIKKNKK